MLVKGSSAVPGNLSEYSIKLYSLEGKDYDITKTAPSVIIFQDILAPFWSGYMFVTDTSNMITNIPIEEGNKLIITWGTQFDIPNNCKGNAKMEFFIYEISDRNFINRDLTTYTIKFATKEFFINKKTRISGKLPQSNNTKNSYTDFPENIISNIMKKYFGDNYKINNSFKSDKAYQIDANNWTPFNSIMELTKIAINNNQADYLFFRYTSSYNTINNPEYRFETISKLYSDSSFDTNLKFLQKPANLKNKDGYDPDVMNSILNFKIKHYNIDNNLKSGFNGNTILSFDFSTKAIKITKTPREYGRKRSDLLEDTDSSSIIFQPKHLEIGKGDINDSQEKWLANRRMNLMKLEQDKLIIQLYGSVCSIFWLGKTCEIVFPTVDDTIFPDKIKDDNYSGKYLITSICQHVSTDKYLVNLSMVKIKNE